MMGVEERRRRQIPERLLPAECTERAIFIFLPFHIHPLSLHSTKRHWKEISCFKIFLLLLLLWGCFLWDRLSSLSLVSPSFHCPFGCWFLGPLGRAVAGEGRSSSSSKKVLVCGGWENDVPEADSDPPGACRARSRPTGRRRWTPKSRPPRSRRRPLSGSYLRPEAPPPLDRWPPRTIRWRRDPAWWSQQSVPSLFSSLSFLALNSSFYNYKFNLIE